jgi:hypothetical protein
MTSPFPHTTGREIILLMCLDLSLVQSGDKDIPAETLSPMSGL